MDVKVGDIITFKSTGYLPDGRWSNRKFIQAAIVRYVWGSHVSAFKKGQLPWECIRFDEIIEIFRNGEQIK